MNPKGEVKAQNVAQSDQITDLYLKDVALNNVGDNYMEIGIELGLSSKRLKDELETGRFMMFKASEKALKMLQLWKESTDETKCTRSVLDAALKKHGSRRCAYCIGIVKKILLLLIVITVTIVVIYCTNSNIIGLNVKKQLPVFGRDNETEHLTKMLMNSSAKFIQITGPPGIGKTYVVKHAVYNLSLIPDCDICIVYIDCYEMEEACYDEKTLFKTIVNRHDGYIYDKYPCLGFLANILRFLKSSSDISFTWWIENLTRKTVLIMDNIIVTAATRKVSEIVTSVKDYGTSIKVVVVSQIKITVPHDEESEELHLRITTLQTKECTDWMEAKYKNTINASSAETLCNALDSYPLAVYLAASYLKEEVTVDMSTLIDMLTSSNDQFFKSYEQFSEDHLKDSPSNLNLLKILRKIIDDLKPDVRKCALRLSEDVSFTEIEAKAYYEDNERFDIKCIRDLNRYSLVHKYSHKYMFIPFIKNFLHFYKPVIREENDPKSYKRFWNNYYRYHTEILQHHLLLNDLDLAIKLGSDKTLVNSLLPLMEGFPLIKLFTTALEVVSDHINFGNSRYTFLSLICVDRPKLLFACSRLTKAVHCPMMHTSTVLTDDNSVQNTSDSDALQRCQVELASCENHIFQFIAFNTTFVNSDYTRSMIEAHGYFNMLLMSTMRDSVPWKLSLRDLAVFLTLLHSHSYTDTNTSAIVTGLKYYVLRDTFESDHFLTDALNSLSDDSGCQTVLKLILIGAIYSETECSAKTCEVLKQHLQMINFTSLKLNCYLGVMNDIILPFLNETQKQFNMVSIVDMLKLKFNKLLNKEKKHCPKEGRASFDCFPLNRFRGIQASRMLRTQKVNMSNVSSSEWLCPALRDVTTKCNDRWPSLSTQYDTDYKQIYSEYLVSLRLFLDDEEFEGWKNKFQSMIDLNAYPYFE